ncbi:VapC toxin family PIN domain ribonuclease [Fodinibius sp.]|uniref:VapC toxin family PIN domain ribonuclease n=1 Tax=Fodinibius sp. TaxID=1872440 RepID=UPI0035689951
MSYLIDTCCISELTKSKPDKNVIQWFSDHNEIDLYLSVITFGELRKGIERLPSSKKKRKLTHWINEDLLHRFKNRALDVTLKEVNQWGKVLAEAEKRGTPLPAYYHDALNLSRDICIARNHSRRNYLYKVLLEKW